MSSHEAPKAGAEQAEAVLRQRLRGQGRELRLLIREAGVVLQGQVVSYYAKQMAQEITHQLTGLPITANEIEVCMATSPVPEDTDHPG
jgi:hypothetical protein